MSAFKDHSHFSDLTFHLVLLEFLIPYSPFDLNNFSLIHMAQQIKCLYLRSLIVQIQEHGYPRPALKKLGPWPISWEFPQYFGTLANFWEIAQYFGSLAVFGPWSIFWEFDQYFGTLANFWGKWPNILGFWSWSKVLIKKGVWKSLNTALASKVRDLESFQGPDQERCLEISNTALASKVKDL